MPLKVPDEGELELMDAIRDRFQQQASSCVLHLYKNNITPADSSVLASFTEATFAGYATFLLDAWGAVQTVGGKAVMVHDPCVFEATASDAQIIYGYYVSDETVGKVLWAERFLTSVPILAGTQITITPRISGRTEF